MEWQTAPNRGEAYYWYRESEGEDPTVMHLKENPQKGHWMATDIGGDLEKRPVSDLSGQWAGPIAPPSDE